jgi:phosphoribosyl 1,2-cyclic phosphate phosphodiesterase
MKTTFTILGSGTSTGVPVITCHCEVCLSKHPRNKRLRASAWLQAEGRSILIDTSTDLRQQALKQKIPRVDAVLLTHPHADHIMGLDELRAWNFSQKGRIPVFGNEWSERELLQKFEYIFKPRVIEGGGIPLLDLHRFDASAERLEVCGLTIIPIPLQHGSQECVAYRYNDLAYVTDCNVIPKTSLNRLQGLDTLVLDCLRLKPHGTHFHLEAALEMVETLKPRRTWLTHLGHELNYVEWKKKLPKNVAFAYDGLKITVSDPT